MFKFWLLILITFLAAPAMAINKCIDDTGKVVYQNAPCPATTKGSELTIQKAPPSYVPPQADVEELNRIRQTGNKMERDRKIKEIDRMIGSIEEQIDEIEKKITEYRKTMDTELTELKEKKQLAKNNLAGATWEQSISSEMSVVSQKYDTFIQSSQNKIERQQKEIDRLQKEKEQLIEEK